MEAELRGGLSLGLSGFTFWSHDIGGFTKRTPEDLYRRWLPMGVLSSHTRCHGQPPKEPWDYNIDFENYFRSAIELKYQLMPYVYAQSYISSQHGWPVLRSLFFEFPEDKGSWDIENEYMYGSDILVAPIFETGQKQRSVYLPTGKWIDYQTNKSYVGGSWHTIESGALNCIILVKSGSILPTLKIAQHTGDLDWKNIKLQVFGNSTSWAGNLIYPGTTQLYSIQYTLKNKKMVPEGLPTGSNFLLELK